jgi:hypothetical protein
MEYLPLILIALACPLMMGLMVVFGWLFARGGKPEREGDESRSLAELRDEQRRIET